MNPDDESDILIEILEVFLNHILYIRNFYPTQIFKKRRAYNTPIYVSIFPPLNTYLHNILQTAQELKRTRELKRVEILFYGDAKMCYERYNFDLSGDVGNTCLDQDDKFLLSMEEQLRASLYMLAERVKPLNKMPHDAKFKVLLHTTQAAYLRLNHNAYHQDFPWLLETVTSDIGNRSEITFLPLTKINSMGMQITAEVL